MDFIPFDASDDEVAERAVLRPGVPRSMRGEITSWLHSVMAESSVYVRPDALHDVENALGVDFSLNPDFTGLINATNFRKLIGNLHGDDLIRVVDYRLFASSSVFESPKIQKLRRILALGRSKYEVTERDNTFRLRSRVSEGVQQAADRISERPDAAGRLLRKAWNEVYDLEPSDSSAYASAVKAVESAAFPAVGITSATATLGNVIRAIETDDANWRLPFLREHSEYPSKEVLAGMLKSLYRGQRDRHGSSAYSDVTHDEAEAAVLMAVTLVGWFTSGLVKRRDPATYQ